MKTTKLGKLGFNLALLLSRSKNADLHVVLDCPPDKLKPIPFAVSIPLQISTSRWKRLLYHDNPVLERVLLDMNFDRLRVVDVRCSQTTEASKVALLRYAPQLREVSILDGGPTVLRKIAWGNILEFECNAPLLEADIKILTLMTNLVWLRLDDLDATTPTCPHASIPLPKLLDLTLDSNCFSTLFRFAAAFDAPLLRSIYLFYDDSEQIPPAALASLEVPEFMPRVSALGLSLPLLPRVSNTLAVWLRNALVLDTLEVWCTTKEVADGTLFDALAVKPGNDADSVLLPKLTSLAIHTDEEKALNDEEKSLNDEVKRLIVSIMQTRAVATDDRIAILEEVTVDDEILGVPANPIHAA
ncbi:hypothetical protein CPB85DRAFT_296470 [Mucidula mucida]|nr:hypothetical protein CPB85DRAFT_296470 [Mucidula mucida]